ncbi:MULTISPECIES: D-2-hydroxyacid dehydrogenase [Weeksella]|uniref:Phosphoglycerate dehydrogenase n=1 Tax=Weeksella virosa (strain ATCC 43766 / DSM 16922 / JCM 21250 / CCUG 30538 / CDC 9751 / IAM 14551 / NBRC 16016 / NCTC 11634 / CL345/78) TaxID=865938 RepID=F0NYL5_WEEVC|nr:MULTISPECIES: D-2-hydroxyacid dehydrogenase [Weeksella]ADX67135.1 Phosphoglycerate dehydrogenase [Weeksella virosa DSM 16922]MDK7375630.1 D-2-hydroxyacid dehydrogenase [Weeksella virosa]MDK7676236.1 D-2-hydroxyacid dehydrogenase [Weeksella virosa]OFM81565.1 3-phosphoglycerate dehydrogenase [Weeksella sp. HMSC059D05]SUP53406.1 D-3-phosphoglycerate dehydrogenase [Weeksella virosa]
MKILANDGISKSGKLALEDKGFTVDTTHVAQEQLANYLNKNNIEVLLVRSATKVRQDLIDATQLKIIGRGGVGLDNIDVDYAKSKGIEVINTPASSSISVAEFVFAHLFGIVRNLHQANRTMPLEGDSNFNGLKKAYGKAYELRGKTIGIIGFGRIGVEVARIAIGMGMKVVIYDKKEKNKAVKLQFFDGQSHTFNLETSSMDQLLSTADFISIHVPSQKGYVIGRKEIEKMKEGVVIINTARGGVLDERALVDAIETGKVLGAALDVFENEPLPEMGLLMNESLSLSPHIAGSTIEAQDRIGAELAEQIIQIYNLSHA